MLLLLLLMLLCGSGHRRGGGMLDPLTLLFRSYLVRSPRTLLDLHSPCSFSTHLVLLSCGAHVFSFQPVCSVFELVIQNSVPVIPQLYCSFQPTTFL
jgi:hypothetical protein